jgi:hypothetical protein
MEAGISSLPAADTYTVGHGPTAACHAMDVGANQLASMTTVKQTIVLNASGKHLKKMNITNSSF